MECVYVTAMRERRQQGAYTATATDIGRMSSSDPAWRRVELVTDRPARVVLRYTGYQDEQVIRCDVGRGGKWDVFASEVRLSLQTLGSGTGNAVWAIHDIASPTPRTHHLAEVMAAGSYDSVSDDRLIPPVHASHIQVSPSSLSGTFDLVAYQDSNAIAAWDETSMPVAGVPLAGITRLTLTCDVRSRVLYTLDT